MKAGLFISSVLLCLACNTSSNRQSDEAAITKLLDNESHFAAKGDSTQWASCWVNSDDVSFIITTSDGSQTFNDFNSLAKGTAPDQAF